MIAVCGEPLDATYRFKRALIQDAAYAMLFADALEKSVPHTIQTQSELLVHHLAQAGFTEPAIDYLRKAAERAIAASANVEAVAHSL